MGSTFSGLHQVRADDGEGFTRGVYRSQATITTNTNKPTVPNKVTTSIVPPVLKGIVIHSAVIRELEPKSKPKDGNPINHPSVRLACAPLRLLVSNGGTPGPAIQ
jgi:hypothetical protein